MIYYAPNEHPTSTQRAPNEHPTGIRERSERICNLNQFAISPFTYIIKQRVGGHVKSTGVNRLGLTPKRETQPV